MALLEKIATFVMYVLSLPALIAMRNDVPAKGEDEEMWYNLPHNPPKETYEQLWNSSKNKC